MDSGNLLYMRPIAKPYVKTSVINDQLNLVVNHNQWLNRLATKLFRVPDKTYIALDSQGAYVWQHCTGQFTIIDIMEAMRKQFGTDAEPVLERLVVFMQLLARNQLIIIKR